MFRSFPTHAFKRYLTQYSRNNQIFLHPQSGNSKSLLASFSKNPNATPIGEVTNGSKIDINPDNFVPNKAFTKILNETISKTVYEDFSFIVEAGVNANTYMPIYDFRRTPNYARIPEVDDIFGYVHVDSNGKMIPDTYESNSLYRLCNGESGIIKLSDYLYEQVQKACDEK